MASSDNARFDVDGFEDPYYKKHRVPSIRGRRAAMLNSRNNNIKPSYANKLSQNLDRKTSFDSALFTGKRTVRSRTIQYVPFDLNTFAQDLKKNGYFDDVIGIQMSPNLKTVELSFNSSLICDKLVQEGLTSHDTHFVFDVDEPPLIGVSILGAPLELPLLLMNDEMHKYGKLETSFEVQKKLLGKKVFNGTRVFRFSKLDHPIPKSITICGRRCRVIYSGQNEHLRTNRTDASNVTRESDRDPFADVVNDGAFGQNSTTDSGPPTDDWSSDPPETQIVEPQTAQSEPDVSAVAPVVTGSEGNLIGSNSEIEPRTGDGTTTDNVESQNDVLDTQPLSYGEYDTQNVDTSQNEVDEVSMDHETSNNLRKRQNKREDSDSDGVHHAKQKMHKIPNDAIDFTQSLQ